MIPGIVDSNPFAIRQPDGPENWKPLSKVVIGVPENMLFRTIATDNNGTWVASGSVSSTRTIASSNDDGLTWTTVTDVNTQFGTNRIRYIDGAFWATVYNHDTTMWYSTDGVNWTEATVNTGITTYVFNMLDDPVNADWVWAVGNDGVRLTTTGMTGTWTNVTGNIFNFYMQDIATNGQGMYVVVGGTGSSGSNGPGKAIYSTDSGTTWSSVVEISPNLGCMSITYNGTYWVAGTGEGVFVSVDAINWISMGTAGLNAIEYNPADGSIVGVGGNTTPIISRDDISEWKNVPIEGTSYNYQDVAVSDNYWMAAGTELIQTPVASGYTRTTPQLTQDFTLGGFPDGVTHTRASPGFYDNAAGGITLAAIDEPRMNYEPDGTYTLLAEGTRTNQALFSYYRTGDTWVVNAAGAIVPNYGTAPDGSNNSFFVQSATGGIPYCAPGSSGSVSYVNGSYYCASVFFRYDANNPEYLFRLLMHNIPFGPGNTTLQFNTKTGAVTTASGSVAPVLWGSKEYADGWVRLWMCQKATATVNSYAPLLWANSAIPVGDGCEAWHVQIEEGYGPPSSPIITEGTAVTRSADSFYRALDPEWFDANEGCIYVESEQDAQLESAFRYITFMSDSNTATGSIWMGTARTLTESWLRTTGDVALTPRIPVSSLPIKQKMCYSWKNGEYARLSIDGIGVEGDVAYETVNGLQYLKFGGSGLYAQGLNKIKKVSVYKTFQPLSDMNDLTRMPYVAPWSPFQLFESGVEMAWYNPAAVETMFTDVAGTIPVQNDGDPVARINDFFGIGPWLQNTDPANQPTYRTDGSHHWLEFDGVSDYLNAVSAGFNPLSTPTTQFTMAYSFSRTADTGGQIQIISNYASNLDSGYTVLSTDSVSAGSLVKIAGTQSNVSHAIPQGTSPRSVSFRYDGSGTGLRSYFDNTDSLRNLSGLPGTMDPSLAVFTIGKAATASNQYLNGNFYGCIVMSKLVSDDDLLRLWKYFKLVSGG